MLSFKTKNLAHNQQLNFHLYQTYCASEYLKEQPKEKIVKYEAKSILKKRGKKNINRESISSIFAHIFMEKENKNEHTIVLPEKQP